MVTRVRLNWTAAGGAGGTSYLHYLDTATGSEISGSIASFLNAIDEMLSSTVSVTNDGTIDLLNTATGELEGQSAISVIGPIVGGAGPGQVPNAAQGLIRLQTSGIVGGRRVRGRIFVPGVSTEYATVNGEVDPGGQAVLAAAGNALRAGGIFVVWSRPTLTRQGTTHVVGSATGWSEFATQRRRRQ